MLQKSRVLEYLQTIPDTISVDELIERIILLQKIETGLEQSKNGQTIPHEEVRNEVLKWFR